MPLHIRSKDITLSEQNKTHIEGVVEGFKKFGLDLTKIYLNITKEKKQVHVEFEVDIAKANAVVINQVDDDLDTAIDLAGERVEKALRRLHYKLTSPQHESIRTMEVDA